MKLFQLLTDALGNVLGCEAELFVKYLVGCRGSKVVQAIDWSRGKDAAQGAG